MLHVFLSFFWPVTIAAWGSRLLLGFDPALTWPVPCSEASLLTPVFCNDPWQRLHGFQWNHWAEGVEGEESSWVSVVWGWGQQGRPRTALEESWVQMPKPSLTTCPWFASNLIDPENINLATCSALTKPFLSLCLLSPPTQVQARWPFSYVYKVSEPPKKIHLQVPKGSLLSSNS